MEKIRKTFKDFKKKNIKQLKFFVLAIIMLIVVIGFSIYLIVFLFSNLNTALVTDKESQKTPVKFEIERFEKLNIVR